MARGKRKSKALDAKSLSKGQMRKLNALKKSLGQDIAERAFSEWLVNQNTSPLSDKNAGVIAGALWPLVQNKQLRIGRQGYFVKRGRGRLIVAPAES
jgi:hypothetical protein